jgi:hypothetical protein
MRKWLTYAFSGVLDEGNVLRAQEALIAKAFIDELVVGENVLMGPNAYIAWDNVTGDKPSQYTDALALAAWKNSNYATYINANGVYSGSFNGGMFNVNPGSDPALESGITIGGWYGGAWKGQALQIKYTPNANGIGPGTIFSSEGGVDVYFDNSVNFRNYARFLDNVDFAGADVDFTGASVTGLNAIYKFG